MLVDLRFFIPFSGEKERRRERERRKKGEEGRLKYVRELFEKTKIQLSLKIREIVNMFDDAYRNDCCVFCALKPSPKHTHTIPIHA